ncbi:MAG TPA: hypothetical protein VEB39_04190 [Sphingomicrobium sp.]|nr:hypothetical protein [Sphingomicrobium sp.]
MLELFLVVGVAGLFSTLSCLALDKLQPSGSTRRLAIWSAIPLPAAILALMVVGSIWTLSWDCPPEDVCDAGGMAFAGIVIIGGIWLCLSLVTGLFVGRYVMRYLRRE